MSGVILQRDTTGGHRQRRIDVSTRRPSPRVPDRIEIGYIDEAADPDPAWETREFWVSAEAEP